MGAAAFDPALAATLATLATLANQSMPEQLVLPGDWALAYQFSSPAAQGGCQYYLAVSPKSKPAVCALVLGAPWSSVIPYYTPGDNHMLRLVPGSMVGASGAKPSADAGFVNMYAAVCRQLWADLAKIQQTIPAFCSQLPLIVAGLGPGAAVAQLASLDLRPGKTESPSPVTSLQSYVFSCPPFGDQDFAAAYATMVPAGFRVQAAADRFAAPASGYVQAGVAQDLGMALPFYDSPWVERDGPYYARLLARQAGAGGACPAGYDPMLAFTLAQLCAVAYQMAQHPGSIPAFPYAPYVLQQNVAVGGSTWACVFEAPACLVVALRGAVSWTELITVVSDSQATGPAWLAPAYGQYGEGLAELYAGARDALRAALGACGDKPVILAGHDCGGALANLMAVDLLQQALPGRRSVQAIYTFGAGPAADPVFAGSFNTGPLAQCNYQVVRPGDVIPGMSMFGGLSTIGTPVQLPGGDFDDNNGSSYHSLYSYIDLLDPRA